MPDTRDYQLGIDSTGAEYWLVPRSSKAPGGHRMVEIRKSKKHVPDALKGMWTSGDSAQRAFDDFIKNQKAVKTASTKNKPANANAS